MSVTTSNHDEIRTWVEARSGVPALSDAEGLGGRPVPALVFPEGALAAGAREVTWTEWFAALDASNLAPRHAEGAPEDSAPFFELVARTA
jgi:hypothetical protein